MHYPSAGGSFHQPGKSPKPVVQEVIELNLQQALPSLEAAGVGLISFTSTNLFITLYSFNFFHAFSLALKEDL